MNVANINASRDLSIDATASSQGPGVVCLACVSPSPPERPTGTGYPAQSSFSELGVLATLYSIQKAHQLFSDNIRAKKSRNVLECLQYPPHVLNPLQDQRGNDTNCFHKANASRLQYCSSKAVHFLSSKLIDIDMTMLAVPRSLAKQGRVYFQNITKT